MSLPAFSVRQVVLVNLVFLLLMVAGIQVARRTPVDFFPDISFNASEISTVWTGASPSEVERLVTKKIEDEIKDISGIKELFSYSSQGLSRITVQWDETLSELEYEAAINDLRGAIDRVDEMPEDAEIPILTELSVSEVYEICIVDVVDVGGVGEFTQREVVRDLRELIDRIPGLRKAKLRSARDREIRVLVDRNRAHQYDLTLSEIQRIIARNNQNFAGGTFTNPDDQEITVRGLGQFVTPEGLAETVVKKNADGSHVRLRDLAEVRSDFAKRVTLSRFNGNPSIQIGISKQADTDLMDLIANVRALVDDYSRTIPEGLETAISWDSSTYVATRISIMRSSLMLGVVFVVFILWLTVGFRNAMLAIVGVPFSFLAAITLFPFFDITINALSLVGFIMVSGMLVDDAIIILENIYRHVEEGAPLREAVVRGSEEVMWPVTAAVATTIAAFIPMLTVSGTSGEFMSILPKTVIVCLLGSLIEALVVLPAHYLEFGSRRRVALEGSGQPEHPGSALQRWSYRRRARVEGLMNRLRDWYLHAQSRVLEHRYAFLAMSAGALVFSLGLFLHVKVDLFPSDFNQLFVALEAPADHGLDQTDAMVRGIEVALEPIRHELSSISTTVGFEMGEDDVPVFGPNKAMLWIAFPDTRQNIAEPDRVLKLVRREVAQYAAAHSDSVADFRVAPPRNGPPIGKPVAIRIQADDYEQAKRIAEEMKAELAAMPGVFNIEDNVPLGPRELQVKLDEHRASIHGLTFDEVGFALLAANDGAVPSSFKDPLSDEDVDIRVLLRDDQRREIADLLGVEIRTPAGHRVQLDDVASIELERGFERLYHFDGLRTVVVYADVDPAYATSLSVNEAMQARFRDVPERYPGVNLVFGGEFQATDDAFSDMRRAFFLAVVAIYGILAAQFRSYVQPLIVMSVIAFSFVGVTVGMWLMDHLLAVDYAMSLYVLYAIVGLAGIVVNDSLVLIDFVNKERERGSTALAAVRAGSRKRFRPILLTTLTTAVGLAPMALGLTGYSRVFGPFAAALVFGLAAASLLTLFLVPTLYLIQEDAMRALHGWRRGPVRSAPGAPLGPGHSPALRAKPRAASSERS